MSQTVDIVSIAFMMLRLLVHALRPHWLYLIAHVNVGALGQEQWHQVHAALLRRQVNGADALPRHGVGVGAVLQQCGPDVHLVLFGSDMQRRVAILRQRERKS